MERDSKGEGGGLKMVKKISNFFFFGCLCICVVKVCVLLGNDVLSLGNWCHVPEERRPQFKVLLAASSKVS